MALRFLESVLKGGHSMRAAPAVGWQRRLIYTGMHGNIDRPPGRGARLSPRCACIGRAFILAAFAAIVLASSGVETHGELHPIAAAIAAK
jgi:hypothetical protein